MKVREGMSHMVVTVGPGHSIRDAASAMTDAYFTDFHPLEQLLNVRRQQEVVPLESRFNAIRGRIGSGLKGCRT